MLRAFLFISLLFTLAASLTLESLGNDSKYELHTDEDYEDYGCIHEGHSQFDDGDSLNIEMLRSVR